MIGLLEAKQSHTFFYFTLLDMMGPVVFSNTLRLSLAWMVAKMKCGDSSHDVFLMFSLIQELFSYILTIGFNRMQNLASTLFLKKAASPFCVLD